MPKINLDDVFIAKTEIAADVKETLTKSMSSFGFEIIQTLVHPLCEMLSLFAWARSPGNVARELLERQSLPVPTRVFSCAILGLGTVFPLAWPQMRTSWHRHAVALTRWFAHAMTTGD